MPAALEFALAAFACYRLSQLVAMDEGPFHVFAKIRSWFGRCAAREQSRGVEHGPCTEIASFLNCPYCLGVWFAAALALLIADSSVEWPLLWLGIAGAQAFLQEVTDGTDSADEDS